MIRKAEEKDLTFHLHTGFTEANRIICFLKRLKPERGEKHEH